MNKAVLSLLAAGALALTVPAIAQPKEPKDKTAADAKKKVPLPKNTFIVGQERAQYFAKTRLIGMNVVNRDGATIGDIEDLILGPNNQVEGVIMGVGGFLGVGEKKIGVRYSALRFQTDKDGKTTVSLPVATKEMLAEVPAYKRVDPGPKGVLQKAGEAVKGVVDKGKGLMKGDEKKQEEKK